ncbi:hypothetical protein M1446_05545 [Candidatus Dependentiae bacterium]|nr:hypothetical protein [Candidatus Dependentiae bacterium]
MKKINILLFLIINMGTNIINSMDSTDDYNCAKCSDQEYSRLRSAFSSVSEEVQINTLKGLIENQDTKDPKNFAQIKALMCSLREEMTTLEKVSKGEVDYEYKTAYELLKLAIAKDKKNVIKLLYNYVPFDEIHLFRPYKFYYGDKKMSDIELLADAAENHQDPIGMAKFLQSFRHPHRVPFEGKVPKKCETSSNNPQLIAFCKYIRESIANHDGNMQKIFNAELEKESQKK